MMKRGSAVVALAVFVLATAIAAQNPPAPPKPGPELKRLDYFVGNWTSELEMKPSPFGPGGKMTTKDHIEWQPGGFFLITNSKWGGAMGEGTELSVWGYNVDEKVYTYDAFSSMGETDHSKGTVKGDTWTWTTTTKMGDKKINGRFTMKELSPTSYSFKFETSPEGASEWSTVMEGKSTKTP